jgi:hypothetical protein
MFFIHFFDSLPEELTPHTLVKADNKEELEVKIKVATNAESVNVLFVDSIDADNHDCDTYISINDVEYKANVYFVGTLID